MKKTNTILDKIIATKKDYLRAQKSRLSEGKLGHEMTVTATYDGSGFYEALKADSERVKIIAEVKKASPSEGMLRDPFILKEINDIFQASDSVASISVITERDYFQGSDEALSFFSSNNINHKPLLRKDFIFDPYQVVESKLLGAQAYLLIASLFELSELQDLVDLGLSIGIEPLVEVHTESELTIAIATNARCIGVNARNLETFKINPGAHQLLRELDDSYVRVAESGIYNALAFSQLESLADAALIGSYFMRSTNITTAIENLVGPRIDSVI